MLLFKAQDVQKAFGDRTIFTFERLEISEGDRVGLVGPNGAGKTTLLRLISGEETPDAGHVALFGSVSFFRQFDRPDAAQAGPGELARWQVLKKAGQTAVSGGEGTRIRLAGTLGQAAHLLLVDEPTTNLDAQGRAFLREALSGVSTFVLVSHDRDLLDALCTRIVEVRDQTLFFYDGNYADYVRAREAERARAQAEYEAYALEKRRLESAYETKKRAAARVVRRPRGMSARDAGLQDFLSLRPSDAKQLRAERAASNIRARIDHLEVRERPRETPVIRPDFRLTDPPGGRCVIEGRGLSFAYGERAIFQRANFAVKNRSHTALVGPNGAGKTTLLRLIAGGFPGIRLAPRARLGVFSQDLEDLKPELSVLACAMEPAVQREEVVRSTLAQLLFSAADLEKPVGVLSGGERVKLALARLIVGAGNVLLLDEPTNFLDAASIERLQAVLCRYEGTLLLVTHDRAFLRAVATDVLSIEGRRVRAYEGGLEAMEAEKSRPVLADDMRVQTASLRVTELLGRLSLPGADRAALEPLYEEALETLRLLRAGKR